MERVLKKVLKGFTFDFRIPAYTLLLVLYLLLILSMFTLTKLYTN